MKTALLTLATTALAAVATAQNGASVRGTVAAVAGKEIQSASVSLLKAADSSLVKTAVSGDKGQYLIEALNEGAYLLNITGINLKPYYSQQFILGKNEQKQLPAIMLEPQENMLQAVVVAAKKPMMEVKADRTIFNVESSINATGSTAMELLQKSPGVLVDKDDNISMKGKNGVRIYIDGKLSPMAASDLAVYLRSLQSNDIEAIEIIQNPSAKYEASGNAGNINIRLKKNRRYGTNGNANMSYNQGIYGKYNAGVSLNYRNKLLNLFSNVNGYAGKNENYQNIYRLQADSMYDAKNVSSNKYKGTNLKLGADLTINNKSNLGVLYTGNYHNSDWKTNGITYISPQSTKVNNQILNASNNIVGNRNTSNFNINYRFADTLGHELNIDADRGLYTGFGESWQPNTYRDAMTSTILRQRTLANHTGSEINLYTAKADYEQNFLKGKLGVGLKYAHVVTNNDFDAFNVINGNKQPDWQKTNRFNYHENVNAAYVNYNRTYKKVSVQAGLRAEQTISKGELFAKSRYNGFDTTDIVKRRYINVFPSAAISYTASDLHQFNLNFSRRIDRPRYQDLNPFEFQLDELTYQKGNSFLRPQYTNSVSLGHTYKSKLTTSLGYSHIADYFTTVNDTARGNATFVTQRNLASQDIYSIDISAPIKTKKWYNGFVNVNASHSRYVADFNDGKSLRLNISTISFNMQHTFTLGHGFTAEASGWYSSPSVWGVFKTSSQWSADAGVQKTALKDKATIKLNVTDIFRTNKWSAVSQLEGSKVNINGGWDSRQVRLNFTYRFGNNQVKESRQRKTGSDSEANRL